LEKNNTIKWFKNKTVFDKFSCLNCFNCLTWESLQYDTPLRLDHINVYIWRKWKQQWC